MEGTKLLYNILAEFGQTTKLVGLIKFIFIKPTVKSIFPIQKDLKQGDTYRHSIATSP